VVETAFEKGAAAAAARVKDTIKIVDENSAVVLTPERSSLMAVQTPQVFGTEAYRGAMRRAQEQNAQYTDDCQLLEQFGSKVFLVDCGYRNIKITTQEDLAVAESFLRAGSEF
jgi:2-C-methyl-D-erythritol 4-phosphate cytidylyltransferase